MDFNKYNSLSPFERDLSAFISAIESARLVSERGAKRLQVWATEVEAQQALAKAKIRVPRRFVISLFVEGLTNVAVHEYDESNYGRYVKTLPRLVQLTYGTTNEFAAPHYLLKAVATWRRPDLKSLTQGCRQLLLSWSKRYSSIFGYHAAERVLGGLEQDPHLRNDIAWGPLGREVISAMNEGIGWAHRDFDRWRIEAEE